MAVTRRDFLKSISIMVGGVAVGSVGFVNHGALAEAPLAERKLPFSKTVTAHFAKIKPHVLQNADSSCPEKWAQAASKILSDNMVLGNIVRRDFSNEVFWPDRSVIFGSPNNFNIKDMFNTDLHQKDYDIPMHEYIEVPLGEQVRSTFDIVDTTHSWSFDKLLETYVAPAMENFGQFVDEIILKHMLGASQDNVKGLTMVDTLKGCRVILDGTQTPMSGRSMIIPFDWKGVPNSWPFSVSGFNLHRMDTKQGVAFHRDSTVLVNRPLAMPDPKLGTYAGTGVVNDLSVRCTMYYNPMKSCTSIDFDMLLGVGVLSPEMICTAELKPRLFEHQEDMVKNAQTWSGPTY